MNKQNIKSKSVALSDIKTPTNIEEFRENLRRYFLGDGFSHLYVSIDSGHYSIQYDEIESLDDLYRKAHPDVFTPSIVPLIDGNIVDESLNPLPEIRIFDGDLFENEDLFELELMWVGIDNQIYRELFARILGEFSGYIYKEVA